MLPYIPQFTAGSTGAMRVKFLAQGSNSKQQYLRIEPGSVGSQADPKPLKPQLPLPQSAKGQQPIKIAYKFYKSQDF